MSAEKQRSCSNGLCVATPCMVWAFQDKTRWMAPDDSGRCAEFVLIHSRWMEDVFVRDLFLPYAKIARARNTLTLTDPVSNRVLCCTEGTPTGVTPCTVVMLINGFLVAMSVPSPIPANTHISKTYAPPATRHHAGHPDAGRYDWNGDIICLMPSSPSVPEDAVWCASRCASLILGLGTVSIGTASAGQSLSTNSFGKFRHSI